MDEAVMTACSYTKCNTGRVSVQDNAPVAAAWVAAGRYHRSSPAEAANQSTKGHGRKLIDFIATKTIIMMSLYMRANGLLPIAFVEANVMDNFFFVINSFFDMGKIHVSCTCLPVKDRFYKHCPSH
jgi:hypothetical protein